MREKRSRFRETAELVGALIGTGVTIAGLLAYGIWADAEVYWLRATFRGTQADALAERQAREFRQLMGVPEPGEGWD
jgi:hypothetical protein